MTKKIEIIGAKPKKIDITDQPKRRVDPTEFADALGANLALKHSAAALDLIGLAELGTRLLTRLRSSGGRPALADATEICRVPLTADDVRSLEKITDQIGQATGTKPSPGQVASMIVQEYVRARSDPTQAAPGDRHALKDRPALAALEPRLANIVRETSELQQKANALAAAVGAIKADLDGQLRSV
jgi:hypothetical protein